MKDHPALVAALGTAMLVAARLLAISRFDVNTAAAILQVAGTGTAVAGTALTLLPFVLVGATLVSAVNLFVDPDVLGLRSGSTLTFALAFAATLSLTAWPLSLVTAVAVVVLAVLGRRRTRGNAPQPRLKELIRGSRLLSAEAIVIAVILFLLPIVLQRPWLPSQVVTVKEGRSIVGYVLGQKDGSVVVMRDEDRTVVYLDADEVTGTRICSGAVRPGRIVQDVPQINLRGSLLGILLWGDDVPVYGACRMEMSSRG